VQSRKGDRQGLAKYIDLEELNKRLRSQSGPLGKLHSKFQTAAKSLDTGDHYAKVELLVANTSEHARIVFQTCVSLLPDAVQNSRDFRAAVAEDVIIPHLDALEKSLENKIAFWTAKESYKGERLELLKIAQQLMKDVREGARWENHGIAEESTPDSPQSHHPSDTFADIFFGWSPFPPDDPRHGLWEANARYAVAENDRLKAELLKRLPAEGAVAD
jgi:hypothetical protein